MVKLLDNEVDIFPPPGDQRYEWKTKYKNLLLQKFREIDPTTKDEGMSLTKLLEL